MVFDVTEHPSVQLTVAPFSLLLICLRRWILDGFATLLMGIVVVIVVISLLIFGIILIKFIRLLSLLVFLTGSLLIGLVFRCSFRC